MNTKDITVNGINIKVRSGRVKFDFLPPEQIFWHGQLYAMMEYWEKQEADLNIIKDMKLPIIKEI